MQPMKQPDSVYNSITTTSVIWIKCKKSHQLNEFGPYDPSDEVVNNYKDNKIIEIYKTITELKLDKNNLYKQIHHQITYT